ncbi:MAG TPA: DUF294 nucleotidyltransferase-like domain-containing protein [Quisquiliibacterium sp.]|nr:DUF294 nucleotidyltransferase-like domain-containing protein [Quisquiliibacterium sp.]
MTSAPSLIAGVRQFLGAHAPFSLMSDEDVAWVAERLTLQYHADGEPIISPDDGPPQACLIVKQGQVDGERRLPGQGLAGAPQAVLHLTPGEVFPVGALMADRPVSTIYRARGDTFCWRLAKSDFDELTRRSPPFLDFCRRRMAALLDLSNQTLQASYAAQATQWRAMSAPLHSLVRGRPVTCARDDSIRVAFEVMEQASVGSVIVLDAVPEGGASVAGIFTRQDVIGRVALAGVSLDAPIGSVMTSPVLTLEADATIADAMLLMAQRSIRHVPIVRQGALVGIVTERDLFVLQRRSLRQIGDAIRLARAWGDLVTAAADIREWSRALVAQGIAAGFVTRLISRLNDQLTARLVVLTAAERGITTDAWCWLALGSEGREEQTIATDQDNGLVFSPRAAAGRDALRALGAAVNERLDACGYPLCKGEVMAGNPRWCLALDEWCAQFDRWIDQGDPDSLLNANIFFDFRPVTGEATLADAMRAHVTARAQGNARFLKQMSDNALRNAPPPSWTGGLLGQLFSGEAAMVDLKLNGTAPFVDAARLLALAHGVTVTGTAERFAALVERGAIPASEGSAWTDAFQFLQSLRLRVQHQHAAAADNPNVIDTRTLSALDRRILKEAFRQARKLQQRLSVDFPG